MIWILIGGIAFVGLLLVVGAVAPWAISHAPSAARAGRCAAVRLARTARTQWTRPPAPIVARPTVTHGRHAARVPAQQQAVR